MIHATSNSTPLRSLPAPRPAESSPEPAQGFDDALRSAERKETPDAPEASDDRGVATPHDRSKAERPEGEPASGDATDEETPEDAAVDSAVADAPQPVATPIAPAPPQAAPVDEAAEALPAAGALGADGPTPTANGANGQTAEGDPTAEGGEHQTPGSVLDSTDPDTTATANLTASEGGASGVTAAEPSDTASALPPPGSRDQAAVAPAPEGGVIPGAPSSVGAPAGGSAASAPAVEAATPTTAASEVWTPGDGVDGPAVLEQIRVAVGPDTRHARLRLDPPGLGQLDIQVSVAEDGSLRARIEVDSAEVRSELRQHVPELEALLKQSGDPELADGERRIDVEVDLADPEHDWSWGGAELDREGRPERDPQRDGAPDSPLARSPTWRPAAVSTPRPGAGLDLLA